MATLSQSQIEMYARAAGFSDPATMAAIAMGESSGRADVVNSIGCVGLWQINQPVWVKSHPTWTAAWLKDPGHNAQAAKVVFDAQGYGAWEAYTNGSYRKFLGGGGGAGTAVQADTQWFDPFGLLPGNDAIGPGNAIGTGLDGLATLAEGVEKAGSWMGKASNWVRVGYVVGGGVLVLLGLYIVASPLLGKAAMKTPYGQIAKQILPSGAGTKGKAPERKPAPKKESSDG